MKTARLRPDLFHLQDGQRAGRAADAGADAAAGAVVDPGAKSGRFTFAAAQRFPRADALVSAVVVAGAAGPSPAPVAVGPLRAAASPFTRSVNRDALLATPR